MRGAADRSRQPVAAPVGRPASPRSRASGLPHRSARVREPDRLLHQAGQAGGTGEGRIELHRAMDVEQGRRHRARLLRHRQGSRRQDADRLGHRHRRPPAACRGTPAACHKGRSTSSTSSSTTARTSNGTYSQVAGGDRPQSRPPPRGIVLNRTQLNFGVAERRTPRRRAAGAAHGARRGRRAAVLDGHVGAVVPAASRRASGCGGATLTISLLKQDYPCVGRVRRFGRGSRRAGAINSPQACRPSCAWARARRRRPAPSIRRRTARSSPARSP